MSTPLPITLRDACHSDVPVLYALQSDPVSAALAGVKPRTEAAFSAWCEDHLGRSAVTLRMIELNDAAIGVVTCFPHNGTVQIGYTIARSFWGRGIATHAVAQFLREVTIRPLEARVCENNHASIRVLQKNGFVEYGRQFSPETERYLACTEVMLILQPALTDPINES